MSQIVQIRHHVALRSNIYRVAPIAKTQIQDSPNTGTDWVTPEPETNDVRSNDDTVVEFVPVERATDQPHIMFTGAFAAQVIGQMSADALSPANENQRLRAVKTYTQAGSTENAASCDVKL